MTLLTLCDKTRKLIGIQHSIAVLERKRNSPDFYPVENCLYITKSNYHVTSPTPLWKLKEGIKKSDEPRYLLSTSKISKSKQIKKVYKCKKDMAKY